MAFPVAAPRRQHPRPRAPSRVAAPRRESVSRRVTGVTRRPRGARRQHHEHTTFRGRRSSVGTHGIIDLRVRDNIAGHYTLIRNRHGCAVGVDHRSPALSTTPACRPLVPRRTPRRDARLDAFAARRTAPLKSDADICRARRDDPTCRGPTADPVRPATVPGAPRRRRGGGPRYAATIAGSAGARVRQPGQVAAGRRCPPSCGPGRRPATAAGWRSRTSRHPGTPAAAIVTGSGRLTRRVTGRGRETGTGAHRRRGRRPGGDPGRAEATDRRGRPSAEAGRPRDAIWPADATAVAALAGAQIGRCTVDAAACDRLGAGDDEPNDYSGATDGLGVAGADTDRRGRGAPTRACGAGLRRGAASAGLLPAPQARVGAPRPLDGQCPPQRDAEAVDHPAPLVVVGLVVARAQPVAHHASGVDRAPPDLLQAAPAEREHGDRAVGTGHRPGERVAQPPGLGARAHVTHHAAGQVQLERDLGHRPMLHDGTRA